MTVGLGLYANFINVCACPFVYQTLKLKQYSLYRLIVIQAKSIFFEQINLTLVNKQNTSLTKVLEP